MLKVFNIITAVTCPGGTLHKTVFNTGTSKEKNKEITKKNSQRFNDRI